MTMYEGPVFDADNHYYEALDAFTRHLDPRLGPRCVQWCDIDGRKYQVVGGRVSRVVNNPTFDPIAKAGAMHDYFRGNPDGRNPLEFLADREPIRPEYRDRDARIAVLEQQGLEGVWMFPTLGMLYEELLLHDVEALGLTFTAFNRWLDEDWGFAYRDKIFAAPYLTLADQDWAIRELEWAIDRGARMIVMRPAAQFTRNGPRTPVTAATRRTATRPTASAPASGRATQDRASRCCTWSGRSTTSSPASCSTASSRASPVSALRASRTAASSSPTCSASCSRSTVASRASSPRTRSRPSGATCGSTRSGRTTRTRSRSSWVPTA